MAEKDREEMENFEEEEEYELSEADVDEVAREVVEPEDREAEEIEEIAEQYVSPGEEQARRVKQAIRRAEARQAQREAGASDLTPEEIEEAMEEAFEETDVDDKVFTPQKEEGSGVKNVDIGEGKDKKKKEEDESEEEDTEEAREKKKRKAKKSSKKLKSRFKVTKSDVKELKASRGAFGSVGSLVPRSRASGLLVADRGPGDVGGPIYTKEEGPQPGFMSYPHKVQRPFEVEPRGEIKLKEKSESGSKIKLSARITPPSISAKPKGKPPSISPGRIGLGAGLVASGGLGAGFASLIVKPKSNKKKPKATKKKARKNAKKKSKKTMKKKAPGIFGSSGSFPFKV